ncbi:FAD-dependent monooxygenase [Dactylosporangium matsuzakiense]|uniref:Salicylate hydroxylase n=1 Tax=Dactylosporangium matsuzakiense TaxID=53360 RepID=A0A9W6KPY4_9ACTN|nr:FAD-dependent monooxygenase [Dactylosporangium matsuzakiense]UWZ42741.1 FAD-dependent monooxygenase [Dactylosporangium matsuzakiense]GLL05393.1 salicylate hydroxylase [Dactylosporangium matsuzakiense]
MPSGTTEPLVVAGAGIGGLTAAVALAAHGIPCSVVERSPALAASGYGIQLPPNATRVLHDLGVSLDAVSLRPEAREIRRWSDGALIGRVPLGSAVVERYGAPYLTLRRADLLRVLLDAAGPVHFGRSWAGECPVIGADGLHSAVRGLMAPDAPEPIGFTAYRAVLPPVTGFPPVVTVWLGPGAHVVAYPVPGGLNLVLVGRPSLDGWHAPVRDLVRAAGPMRGFPLYTRPPLPAWHRDGSVVIGDAAHPMPPFLAQGAAQAIEDAFALPSYLHDLAAFEALRRPRTDRVAGASSAGGVEYHLPDGPRQRRRDEHIAAASLSGQDWLFT